jgi:hypothetical protein
MSGLEPVVIPAMMAATEAGGAGMAAAAAAEAAAAASAAGLGASAIPGIAATAAGSAVPGAALPAMAATGTQGGLAGAMGTYAPVFTAGVDTAGLAGPGGTGTVMGSVLPGMNQSANLLTTPFAKFIDTMGPMARKAGNAYQMGSKFGNALTGQQQAAQRQIQPPAPAPAIPQMPQQTQRTPTPVELLAWRRAQQRKRMMGQSGGMMS